MHDDGAPGRQFAAIILDECRTLIGEVYRETVACIGVCALILVDAEDAHAEIEVCGRSPEGLRGDEMPAGGLDRLRDGYVPVVVATGEGRYVFSLAVASFA
jgi:hypothetical protein